MIYEMRKRIAGFSRFIRFLVLQQLRLDPQTRICSLCPATNGSRPKTLAINQPVTQLFRSLLPQDKVHLAK